MLLLAENIKLYTEEPSGRAAFGFEEVVESAGK